METKREFSGRFIWERRLARSLGSAFGEQLNVLMRSFGDRVSFDSIPAQYWQEYNQSLVGIFQPTIESVALAAAEEIMAELPIGIDWALVNADAAGWSSTYSYDLVKGIEDNTRAALRKILPNYYEQGWTLGQLEARLQTIYSPVRAAMIAITEVTRASVEGERMVVSRIVNENGLIFTEIWRTAYDDLVCPICAPRNGKAEGTNWTRADGPPAHPRCRCFTTHRLERPL